MLDHKSQGSLLIRDMLNVITLFNMFKKALDISGTHIWQNFWHQFHNINAVVKQFGVMVNVYG